MRRIGVLLTITLVTLIAIIGATRRAKPPMTPPQTHNIDIRMASDISGSMGATLDEVKRGLLDIASGLQVGDRVVLVVFCDIPQVLWAGDIKSADDVSTLKATISNLQATTRMGTDQVEGYRLMLNALPDDGRKLARRYLVVCSDSYADMPDGTRREWKRINFNALSRDVSLRLFYYNNERDTDFLRLLTQKGVRYRVASSDESLSALQDLKAEIGYVHSGQWRETNLQQRRLTTAHPSKWPLTSAAFPILLALAGALLLALLVGHHVNQRGARAKWQAQKVREAELGNEAAATREVLRLFLPELNQFFQRDIVALSAFTFGTPEGTDFRFRIADGVGVDGAIEVKSDGGLVLINRESTFPWRIGEDVLRSGERLPLPGNADVSLSPKLTLHLRRETIVADGAATVDVLLRAAREQRRAALPVHNTDARPVIEEVGLR